MSIYAFAIDNFSRSEKEVGALMNLAKQRLTELCQHGCARLSLHFFSCRANDDAI